jgi:hypothetical protein
MRIVVVVVVAAIVMYGVPAWLFRRLRIHTEQFVRLTEKRHAELLDVERRQHEEQ